MYGMPGMSIFVPMQDQAVSVSELTYVIKGLLEEGIGDVLVSGEISNFKQHSSGHRYFTLKDADAQIGAVMWRTRSLTFRPEDGMRVLVRGRLSVYPPQGKYQIDVSAMRPEGVGDLHRAFEQLREALRARGLFDADRKTAIPRRPRSVGIATSQTGAALQDMLSTINRRYPLLDVVFRPTLVQGDGAADDIAKAIIELDAAKLDVIIIGRGGGSLEDLWSFNTEVVAMAIANARTPIISAVGHETDVTISDFVADVRAETPTAAAVLVTPITVDDLLEALDERMLGMTSIVRTRIDDMLETAESFVDGRAARRVTERIHIRQQRVDELVSRTSRGIQQHTNRMRQHVEHMTQYLTSLHPLAPLRRGYAVVERDGVVLGPSDRVQPGDTLVVQRFSESSTVEVRTTTPPPILPPTSEHHGNEGENSNT
jgi:exodeoxyribonuclease VII large subunit